MIQPPPMSTRTDPLCPDTTLFRSRDPDEFGDAADPSRLPALKQKIGAQLLTKSRDEWCRLLEPFDTCFAPILSMDEAPHYHHNQARGTRSEEHTSELQSLMRISYAVFCLKKKKNIKNNTRRMYTKTTKIIHTIHIDNHTKTRPRDTRT